MKEVQVNGETYIRTAAAAKRFGYSQDYLGQLAREGRIEARRVGRSWFVSPSAIAAYQEELEVEAKALTATSQETDARLQTDNTSYSVAIHQMTQNEAAAAHQQQSTSRDKVASTATSEKQIHIDRPHTLPNADSPSLPRKFGGTVNLKRFSDGITLSPNWQKITYEDDRTELQPVVRKDLRDIVEDVPVESAETKPDTSAPVSNVAPVTETRTLVVHSSSDRYSIIPSEIPSVRLRGKIPIETEDVLHEMSSTLQTKGHIAALAENPANEELVDVPKQSAAVTTQPEESPLVPSAKTYPPDRSLRPKSVTEPTQPEQPARLLLTCLIIFLVGVLLAYVVLSIENVTVFDANAGETVRTWSFVPISIFELLQVVLR